MTSPTPNVDLDKAAPEHNRRIADVRHTVMEERFGRMSETLTDIRGCVRGLEVSMTKLILIEERQVQLHASIERNSRAADKQALECDAIALRVANLEHASPTNRRVTELVDKLLVGAVVLVAMFVANRMGLG